MNKKAVENKASRTLLKLERLQGPPRINKVNQYEIVFSFMVRLFIQFIQLWKRSEFVYLTSLAIKSVNKDICLLIKIPSPKLHNAPCVCVCVCGGGAPCDRLRKRDKKKNGRGVVCLFSCGNSGKTSVRWNGMKKKWAWMLQWWTWCQADHIWELCQGAPAPTLIDRWGRGPRLAWLLSCWCWSSSSSLNTACRHQHLAAWWESMRLVNRGVAGAIVSCLESSASHLFSCYSLPALLL